ncbi:MAG: acyl-ACP--UDP-N-acetylglucosamine O-acyltransferase [Phycisphaerae bacterium]|nr:acyl-ACP--UDP-N-acetylglucosamine O-acyltransferase [Phycisphaerae bacterium]
MPTIHPTAIIDRNAQLADDVQVGPFTVVGPQVRVGSGTTIGSHCVIENRTTIGRHNRIFHRVHLGQEPQDLKYRGEAATLEIGDHNQIRENVTAHIGTDNGGGSTTIGSHTLVMVGAHIAHDCHVGSYCILSNNVMLAGHIEVMDHAILAGGAGVQHYVSIGRYAFVGGLSAVVHDAPPFLMSDGHPARARAVNAIGLQRHRFDDAEIANLKQACVTLYGRRVTNQAAMMEKVEAEQGHDRNVMELVQFVRRSAAAPNGRYAEMARRDNKRSALPR